MSEEAIFAVREVLGGAQFGVRVQPGSSREGVVGVYGDEIKIAINAPAVEGQANDALIRLIADLLKVSRRSVSILTGYSSRSKVVRVLGVSSAVVEAALEPPTA